MDEAEKQAAIQRYNDRLARFGATEKALGWGDKGRSRLRFEILAAQWPLGGRSVLDFGCGFGDLYAYLKEKGIADFDYLGVDINPRLIEIARERHPAVRFETLDVSSAKMPLRFDYVLSSGVFNFKLKDNMGFVLQMFGRFDEIASRGFASNFLSSKVDFELADTFHADPSEILRLGYTFSNNVVLRNDYMPYEFTIFVNKASAVDPRYVAYEEYVRFL